jgi:hypothetical protein
LLSTIIVTQQTEITQFIFGRPLRDLDVEKANFRAAHLIGPDFTGFNWWQGASVAFAFKGNEIVEVSRVSTCPYAEVGASIAEDQKSVNDQTLSITFCPSTNNPFTKKFSRVVDEPLGKAHREELNTDPMQKRN